MSEEKAELIKYDENLVYHDNQERYFFDQESLVDFIDDTEDDTKELEYLYVSEPHKELHIDAYDILELPLSSHHSEAIDEVDVNELQNALNNWCFKNRVTSWTPSVERRVSIKALRQVL